MNDIKGIIEDVEKGSLESDKVIKKVIEIIGQEKWQDIYDELSDICTTTGELIITLKRIPDLEKENAELQKEIRCECTRCVYSDSPCIRSDYGVENDEEVCPNYENVFTAYTQLKEENAELKKTVEHYRKERAFFIGEVEK